MSVSSKKEEIIDGSKVQVGDALIAVGSSGPHSNGYSLVRKILEVSKADKNERLAGKTIGEHLLAPTKIYIKSGLKLIAEHDIHAISHITGGGFWETFHAYCQKVRSVIDGKSWEWPVIFQWLQEKGNVTTHEMYRTFNCGVGLIIALPKDQANAAVALLQAEGETAWVIGEIAAANSNEAQVEIN